MLTSPTSDVESSQAVQMSSAPQVSVIIAARNAQRTIARCLESLRAQETEIPFEVIVVDSSRDGTEAQVRASFPEARCLHFEERKYCGDARNIGAREARGDVLAFIDADCVADRRWIAHIAEAHRASDLVVGGAVGNANPESLIGWGAYLSEFNRWLPETAPAWMEDIAGANLTYKREVLERYGAFIEGTYCSDTELHWRLAADGHRLRFDPSLIVQHRNIERLRELLHHELYHGYCFARVRVGAQGFSRRRRLAFAGAAPLVFTKILAEALGRTLAHRRYHRAVAASIPFVVAGIACWTIGETAGNLLGARRASRRGDRPTL